MSVRDDIEKQVLARWELAAGEVRSALEQSLVVAFLGSASSGKDAAIRALFGIDFGQVDPIPGSTETVRVSAVDAAQRFMVLNAPGFGDIREHVDQRARHVLDQLDLAIYLVNCDGGATIDERRDLDAIRALGRPVLVCLNKIDLIRPHQREDFVRTTLAQLAVAPEDARVTAFDPLPALSETPIGTDGVVVWIHEHLETHGKSLLFAKHVRNKATACDAVIGAAARNAAVAGALPIPGADAAALTAIHVRLISDLATIYGRRIDKELILFILGEALAGSSKGFVRWSVNALKAAGWLPGAQLATIAVSALGATVASATTWGVGKAAVAFLQREGNMSGVELREIFDKEATQWQQTQTET